MSRWSPTVLPEAGPLLRPMDIGGALADVGEGVAARRERQRREAREAELRRRQDEETAYRRGRDAAGDRRQADLDTAAAEDRRLRQEGDYVLTRGRLADDGYVDGGTAARRRDGYRAIGAGGDALGGPMGSAVRGIGDALLAGQDTQPAMSLTRPGGGREDFAFDPTQTREARTEASTLRLEAARDARRPPPRDTVGDSLAEYEGKVKIDQRYGINDFAPKPPRGGGSGSGESLGARVTIADKLLDDATQQVSAIERQAPKPPNYDEWRGGPRPMAGERDYPAYAKDSTAMATGHQAAANAHAKRLQTAQGRAEQWFNIADALAKEAVGATGVDSVSVQNRTAAQLAIRDAQARFNAILAQAPNDPQTRKELGEAYADEVREINAKYGIRPRPDE